MVRILVAGDVEGKLDLLFERVSKLHTSPTHGKLHQRGRGELVGVR
jgi:hypothetical protein